MAKVFKDVPNHEEHYLREGREDVANYHKAETRPLVTEHMRTEFFDSEGWMGDDTEVRAWYFATQVDEAVKSKAKVVSEVYTKEVLDAFEAKSIGGKVNKVGEKQVGGDHYKNMAITPTEYIEANHIGWSEGNVIKYISRHQNKNGRQDVEKALHYCELLLKQYDETDRLIANRK